MELFLIQLDIGKINLNIDDVGVNPIHCSTASRKKHERADGSLGAEDIRLSIAPVFYDKTLSHSNIQQSPLSLRNIYFFAYIEEMREHNYLGEFELMLLLTLIHLGDDAYGVPLSRELALRRGRDVSVGSVYAALDRLELKGLVASNLGDSTPERGGRAKRYFRVTRQGLRSVHETRKVLTKLWKSLPSAGKDFA
jgi:PadR family transcriptional regulator PadR